MFARCEPAHFGKGVRPRGLRSARRFLKIVSWLMAAFRGEGRQGRRRGLVYAAIVGGLREPAARGACDEVTARWLLSLRQNGLAADVKVAGRFFFFSALRKEM